MTSNVAMDFFLLGSFKISLKHSHRHLILLEIEKGIVVQSFAETHKAQSHTQFEYLLDSTVTSLVLHCTQSKLKQLQI